MKATYRNISFAITIITIGATIIAGCLQYPPLISEPKLALYYTEHSRQPVATTSIKRWLPETGASEVLLQQEDSSELGIYTLGQLQPYGSSFLFESSSSSITSTFISVVDSEDRTPRLLNVFKIPDEFGGGPWTQWSPDGKHIGTRFGQSLIITDADGSNRKTIDTLDNFATYFAWSPDGLKLAYNKASDLMEVVDVDSGEKTHFRPPEPDLRMYYSPQWLADSRHIFLALQPDVGNEDRNFIFDIEDPAATQERPRDQTWQSQYGFSWDDRSVQSTEDYDNLEIHYRLVFTDGRADVPLFTAPLDDYATFKNSAPAWSHDGDKLSYVTDINNDGSEDIVIASKDGIVLQMFTNIDVANVAALEWSPDNTKLFVATVAMADEEETVQGKLLTLSTAEAGKPFSLIANPEFSFVRIEWSPNSSNVTFRIETYDEDNGYIVNARGLLIDAENAQTRPTWLFAESVSWSPDSNYLALTTLNATDDLNEVRSYEVAIIALKQDSRGLTNVIAENTDGDIEWSNSGMR